MITDLRRLYLVSIDCLWLGLLRWLAPLNGEALEELIVLKGCSDDRLPCLAWLAVVLPVLEFTPAL